VNQQEEGTGYFFDHRSWGQAAFSKNKKQPVPEKTVGEKVACPRFTFPLFAVSVWFFSSLLSEVNAVDDVKIASTGSTVAPAIRNRRTKWIFS
jgi:hypothetical protein